MTVNFGEIISRLSEGFHSMLAYCDGDGDGDGDDGDGDGDHGDGIHEHGHVLSTPLCHLLPSLIIENLPFFIFLVSHNITLV